MVYFGPPRRRTPRFTTVLEALMELSRLAHAVISKPDADLFDFECEAIEDLVELGARLGAHRAEARRRALRLRLHAELAHIYEALSRSAPRKVTRGATPRTTPPERAAAAAPLQRARASAAAAREDLVARSEGYLPAGSATALMVDDVSKIRDVDGAASLAEQRLRLVGERTKVAAGGTLRQERRKHSHYYEARALEDPFPGGDAGVDRATMAWLWKLIASHYAMLTRPTGAQAVDLPSRLRRLMAWEVIHRQFVEFGEQTGPLRDLLDQEARAIFESDAAELAPPGSPR